MKPVICQVKHDPPNTHGDCVRACVASILELPAEEVQHFYADGDPFNGQFQLQNWLAGRGKTAAIVAMPGHWTLLDVHEHMYEWYRDRDYILWCTSGGGNHAVVGRNMEITHNPAWYRSPIDGPMQEGFWLVMLLADI